MFLLLQALQFTTGNLAVAGYFVLGVVVAGVPGVADFFAATVAFAVFCCSAVGNSISAVLTAVATTGFLKNLNVV